MMKRTILTSIFILGFMGSASAQDAPPTGIGYIPGMPIPQAAPQAPAASSDTAPANGNSNDNAKISKVSVAGKHGASVTPETQSANDFSAEKAALKAQTPEQTQQIHASYQGVTPPIRLVPENESTFTKESGNQLSWIGFMPDESMHRIFVQTTQNTTFERLATPSDRVEILLPNTKLAVSNNNRELDMSFFQTPFSKAQAVKSGKGVKVIVQLKDAVPCEVTQQDNMINIIVRK